MISMEEKIAIVIPAYKCRFLRQTLDSIVVQTCRSFTVYIGDDASPQNLKEIVSDYADKMNIVYRRFDTNLGGVDLPGHWDRCIALAKEPVVWFFSDDDLMRTVLRLHPALAPFKCAILPLSKKLGDKAREIQTELSKYFMVDYDDAGSIGKRYRRQDEIGTPFCITLDFQTVGDDTTPADHCVTVRERDSMEQVRIPMSEVKNYIAERIKF